MSRRTYDIFFDDPSIDAIGIYLREGENADSIMEQFRQISSGRQALVMNSNARIREISLNIFDRTFVITDVLYCVGAFAGESYPFSPGNPCP